MNMEFTLNDLQRRRVEDHLALVEQVLRRSIKTNETVDGMGHDDLYQEGCIALCGGFLPGGNGVIPRLCQGRDSESFIGSLPGDPICAKKSAVVVAGCFCRDGSAGAGQPFSHRKSDL